MRRSLSLGPISLVLILSSGSLLADIVWKAADEGPRTPVITEIVGDDTRTIAVTVGSAAEFDGKVWHPISLNTDAVVPASRQMFAASGQIAAVSLQDNTLRLFFLKGNEWSLAATLPFGYHGDFLRRSFFVPRGDDRIYVPDLVFNSCSVAGDCPAADSARHLRSISLVDGSIRQEPDIPACWGLLFTVSNRLYLIQYSQPSCAGPSVRTGEKVKAMTAGLPFFRLDGDQWTALDPWTQPLPFAFTQNAACIGVQGATTADRALVLFTSQGLSSPIPLSSEQSSVSLLPLESDGRNLVLADKLYEVRDGSLAPFAPACPVQGAQFFAAGKRLFAWTEGWNVFTLGTADWEETFGVPDIPGGQTYIGGRIKVFAIRGSRLFRRDDPGWVSLPSSPSPPNLWSSQFVCLGDDLVLVDRGNSATYGAYRYDTPSGQWVDLHLPPSFTGTSLVHEDDLYVGGAPNGGEGAAVWHQGNWTTVPTGAQVWLLREVNGGVYVFGCRMGPTGSGVCRIDEGQAVEAFPGMDPDLSPVDVVGFDGKTLVSVTDSSARSLSLRRALVSDASEAYRTLLRDGDFWGLAYGTTDLQLSLVPVDGQLLFRSGSYDRGQLRAQRSPVIPSIIDPSGRFAFRDITSTEYYFYRGPLLVPTVRVRKNLAAAVDATGLGGVHYRSELHVANFSSTSSAVARVFAGARQAPVLEIPLGPGVQVTIEDPVPGFLGPVAVEFDGLVDEEDAWAAIRVWSPSDGGTASTSLIGTNPGDMPGQTFVAPPPAKPGSRTHAAFSASGDGAGETMYGWAFQWGSNRYDSGVGGNVADGGFLQGDFPQAPLLAPVVVSGNCQGPCYPLGSVDDLGAYLVRNEEGTNDGAIVPLERPDVTEGRLTRFLPAVVSLSSRWGTYRTEMTLAWRSSETYPPLSLDFNVIFRNAAGAWTMPISIPSYQPLQILDAGAWLVANGVPVDPANVDGTLTFTSDREEGAADLLVTAIVTARGPGASGDYGVSIPVFNEVQWASTQAIVPGLREDPAFRSNLAIANPEPDGGPPVTVTVSLRRASDGAQIGVYPPVQLTPGQRVQLNQPLSEVAFGGEGYAVITRAAGTGRFVAYGVVNDNVTGDGTLFPMTGAK